MATKLLVGLKTYPGTLKLEQQQSGLSGVLQSPFGVTKLERGSVDEEGFRFLSSARVEGRVVEMTVEGSVSGEEIRGTVRSEIGFARFTGTRQKS
jgi:hypothetical protein